MPGFSVKLPLEYNQEDKYWGQNKTIRSVIKQNLKMLILTCPGERVMLPEFGVGLRNFLFEQEPQDQISGRIYEQVSKYMSFIKIDNLQFEQQENMLFIKLSYSLPGMNISDSLILKEQTVRAE